jgi:hypothetical protein
MRGDQHAGALASDVSGAFAATSPLSANTAVHWSLKRHSTSAITADVIASGANPLGHHAEANQALADLRKIDIGGNLVNVADVYAWFGDADQAFAVLDQAVAARESDLTPIFARRSMDSPHMDPRWNALLRKIALLQ